MYFGIFDEIRVKNLNLKGKNSILIRIFEPNSYGFEHSLIINSFCYKAILELYIYMIMLVI